MRISKFSFKYELNLLMAGKKIVAQYLEEGKTDTQANWKDGFTIPLDCSVEGASCNAEKEVSQRR